MNVLNIAFCDFENQKNLNNRRALHSNYHDYETEKCILQNMNLSNREFEIEIQTLSNEMGL
jgi:hypothetical protein